LWQITAQQNHLTHLTYKGLSLIQMIQLKSAPTIVEKYEGKELWMAFAVSKTHQSVSGVGDWRVIQHD
jgi:hypothetical protein